jgi:hypothetical protein
VTSDATTAREYVAALPEERRAAIEAVRRCVNGSLPRGYREGVGYGMITWSVPLAAYPDTYNGQPLLYAALASQKQYMALYLMCVYGDDSRLRQFRAAFAAAGKRLDMGKSCVRFRSLDELHLPAIAAAIGSVPMRAYVAFAQAAHSPGARAARRKTRAKAAAKPASRSGARAKARPKARSASRAGASRRG